MYQNRKFKEIMTIFGHVGLELQALPYLHRVVSYIVTITRHPDAYINLFGFNLEKLDTLFDPC
jgi:hypothetical protein